MYKNLLQKRVFHRMTKIPSISSENNDNNNNYNNGSQNKNSHDNLLFLGLHFNVR